MFKVISKKVFLTVLMSTIVASFVFSQSKKEQIRRMNQTIDSLNRVIVKEQIKAQTIEIELLKEKLSLVNDLKVKKDSISLLLRENVDLKKKIQLRETQQKGGFNLTVDNETKGSDKSKTDKNSPKDKKDDPTSPYVQDYFGTGGMGGGKGRGMGKGDLYGKGNGGGDGEGYGFGDGQGGKERERMNNINTNHIKTATTLVIRLKLTINEVGKVVDVATISIIPNSTPRNIIEEVKNIVKEQLRFSEKPGAPLETAWHTVRITPQ